MSRETRQTTSGTNTTSLDRNTQGRWDTLWNLGLQEATRGYRPYGGSRIAEFSPDTMGAMKYWRDNGQAGMGAVNQAVGIAGQQYTPQQIQAARAQAAQMNRGGVRDVYGQNVQASPYTAGQFQGDVQGFMNPYTSAVVDTSLGDIERFRQMQRTSDAGSATAAGAWGGSRHGVADAETNRAALDTAARTAAQLRSQGFEGAAGRAMAAGQQGAALGLQAGLANQGTNLQAALANQGYDFQTGALNTQNQQQTNLSNAQLAQQAALANQAAGLQGRALNLQGAGLLGSLGAQQQGMAGTYAQGLLGQGQLQDARQQAQLDAAYQEYLRGQNWNWNRLQGLGNFIGGGTATQSYTGGTTDKQPATPGNIFWGWSDFLSGAGQNAAGMYGGG